MSNIDLDELNKLIEQEEELKKPTVQPKERENKDVLKFIRDHQLTPGENKVPTYVIYYVFTRWTLKKWKRRWKKEEFFRTFKKHFEQKRHGNQRFYMVNDAIELTDELYEKAKKYDKTYKRKKDKKSKIKTSSSRSKS
jgi:hypothetical protein